MKASLSQKVAEPAKGEEAFQMSEGGKGAIRVGRKNTQHELMIELSHKPGEKLERQQAGLEEPSKLLSL